MEAPKATAKAEEVKPKEAVMEEAKKEEAAPTEAGNLTKPEKICAIIEENPEGISLPEIAYIMGVAFVSITRDVKNLLTDGKIKKEDGKYYPG